MSGVSGRTFPAYCMPTRANGLAGGQIKSRATYESCTLGYLEWGVGSVCCSGRGFGEWKEGGAEGRRTGSSWRRSPRPTGRPGPHPRRHGKGGRGSGAEAVAMAPVRGGVGNARAMKDSYFRGVGRVPHPSLCNLQLGIQHNRGPTQGGAKGGSMQSVTQWIAPLHWAPDRPVFPRGLWRPVGRGSAVGRGRASPCKWRAGTGSRG